MSFTLSDFITHTLGPKTAQYRLDQVDLLSPYLSAPFFQSLAELSPTKIFLTTDAGCNPLEVDGIRRIFGRRLASITLGSCRGIVHCKAFLFHWKHKVTGRYKRFLLWGSCNATASGFGANAESYSWFCLSNKNRGDLKAYFCALRGGQGTVPKTEIDCGEVMLILPAFRLGQATSTFETWIQRGRLCQAFPPDGDFRKLKVRLLSKPGNNVPFVEELARNGLTPYQQTTISYDYMRQSQLGPEEWDDAEVEAQPWRSKYFVHTMYGYWTSDECFHANSAFFKKKDHERRSEELSCIASASNAQRRRWSDDFLNLLTSIASRRQDARKFLHIRNGALDIDKYREMFDTQILRQRQRAQDPWFRQAYISGFVFPPVPPMRDMPQLWNEFLKTLAESLVFELGKRSGRNRLAKALRKHEIANGDIDCERLLSILCGQWDQHKDVIQCFHKH